MEVKVKYYLCSIYFNMSIFQTWQKKSKQDQRAKTYLKFRVQFYPYKINSCNIIRLEKKSKIY